ncbi:MAG TPA: prolipoprotein diacylglyceryl transferase [Bryobacteraceae bacterium]|nr:prolipoprotein diacylglyceryl transferase [Bryobacteraceae bacterium]
MFPRLISIGSFFLPTYGVLVALGFLLGLYITVRLARRAGLKPDLMVNLAIYSALAGLLGAKISMLLFDFPIYWAHPGEIFTRETLQAAGVYQGGLILGIIVAAWYIRSQKLPWLTTFDVFSPGIAAGHAIGRLGCFAAGCCWGIPTRLPWGVTFRSPQAYDLTGVPLGIPLHPTQLYESLSEAILFAILFWRIRRPHAQGTIIGLYLILYSISRFVIEFYRFHEQARQLGLSLTQWMAIGLALLGVWILLNRKAKPAPARA